MEYIKKPVMVEAFQWNGDDARVSDPAWFIDALKWGAIRLNKDHLSIRTVEGNVRANINDWIIRGVEGEIYPCKPDIFASTYEEVTVANVLASTLTEPR